MQYPSRQLVPMIFTRGSIASAANSACPHHGSVTAMLTVTMAPMNEIAHSTVRQRVGSARQATVFLLAGVATDMPTVLIDPMRMKNNAKDTV
jgi:hypothetical protein